MILKANDEFDSGPLIDMRLFLIYIYIAQLERILGGS